MLTGPLARARRRQGRVRPAFVDPDDDAVRALAGALMDVVRDGVARGVPMGALEDEVEEIVREEKDPRMGRGLAKLLLDRVQTTVDAPLPPVDLRARVFEAAAARGGVALESTALGRLTADDVLREVATSLGSSIDAVRAGLYADLPHAQRVTACEADLEDIDGHLHRYNLALAQVLLVKANRVEVSLDRPTVPRLRQLLRQVKMFHLLATITRRGDTVTLSVEGPLALFRQAQRYGLQLATFLGALVLQERWSLVAEVAYGGRTERLELNDRDGLKSHHRDVGAWEGREQAWFRERFAAAAPDGWVLSDEVVPIDLGGEAWMLPDFALRAGDRVAWLEIVGFWHRAWLTRRLELLARFGPGNLILAVSRKLATELDAALPSEVVAFAEVVPVRDVLAAAERVARPG